MSNASMLAKFVGFMLFVAGMLIIIASDSNFKSFEPLSNDLGRFQDSLENNPLQDLQEQRPGTANYPVTTEVQGQSGIPIIGPIIDFFADTGRAIWGFIQTVVTFLVAAGQTAAILLDLFIFLGTWTIPGIPFFVQIILWSINFPMWFAIIYIAFTAIRGS